eukprot:10992539-Heterocapsa_arctica.AAC.1
MGASPSWTEPISSHTEQVESLLLFALMIVEVTAAEDVIGNSTMNETTLAIGAMFGVTTLILSQNGYGAIS